jgi:para-nitrobenzyl esterase
MRWKAPASPEVWDGVRDGSEFGAICPQNPGRMEAFEQRQSAPAHEQSEDCLTLNVWTPDLGSVGLPVAVWIHGGAFNAGSARIPWYHAHNFARDGVVCVTINYRVSALAFLYLDELFPELHGTGTLGIQDQVAALRWVQDNITSFGGDPNSITIFGESAGGGSVGTLLGFPSARGLFHKAIPQSGASHWSHPPEIATRVARRFISDAGVEPGDTDALLALPVERILEIVGAFGEILISDLAELLGEDFAGAAMPFQPVVDGETLPERPIDALRGGSAKDVSVLVGTCRDEWKLWSGLGGDAGQARAPRMLRNLCAQAGRSVDELVAAYEKSTDGSEAETRGAIETDRTFRIPAIRLAEAQTAHGVPTWMYRFDWPTPAFGGRLGACHAIEIPFVFDNLSAPGADAFLGGAAPQELATNVHSAWVSFMKSGDPGWNGYDTQRRATMIFDSESKVVDDPDGQTRALWDGLL